MLSVYDSVAGSFLSDFLGMSPGEWGRKAKQRYDYILDFEPVPASGRTIQVVEADTDSWFIGMGAIASNRDPATDLIVTDRPFTVEIERVSGGRRFQSAPEDFDNVFGTASLPAPWSPPLFLWPNETVLITITNLIASARDVRVTLFGFKIFNTDMGVQ